MSEFIIACDVPFDVDALGGISCTGNVVQYERPVAIADLSQSEIGDLSAAVLILFTIAFVFRKVRKQFF
jgi:hypothetical protein